jgi:hypothetical protein
LEPRPNAGGTTCQAEGSPRTVGLGLFHEYPGCISV